MNGATRAVFTGHLDWARAEALAGVLGVAPPEDLPLLWHWIYLLPSVPQDQLGPDGHPLSGVPAPPGPGMRRMFAGGSARSLRPLRLGRIATRITELVGTRVREGRSGTLTFATVRTTIEQDRAVAVQEEQTIVYRAAAPAGPPAALPPADPAPTAAYVRSLVADPVLLFRFSALTYNAHRIHYDRDYATGTEGYPDLVVHGPLQALLMLEAARVVHGSPATEFEFRLEAPSFAGQQLWISADRSGVASSEGAANGGEPVDEVRTTVHIPGGRGASGTARFGTEPSPAR